MGLAPVERVPAGASEAAMAETLVKQGLKEDSARNSGAGCQAAICGQHLAVDCDALPGILSVTTARALTGDACSSQAGCRTDLFCVCIRSPTEPDSRPGRSIWNSNWPGLWI